MPGAAPLTPAELRAFAPFSALNEEQLDPFLTAHRLLDLPAGQRLLLQGDWADGVYVIRSGIAKVMKVTLGGESVVLALIGAGELFGEMALLLGKDLRTADVHSLTTMQLIKLRSQPFLTTVDHCPAFARGLATLQSQRLCNLGNWYALRSADALTRVMATLVELAVRVDHGHDPRSAIPDLTQREIADIAGLARGTVSRILNRLRSRGTVEEDEQGMRIVDLEPFRKRGLLSGTAG